MSYPGNAESGIVSSSLSDFSQQLNPTDGVAIHAACDLLFVHRDAERDSRETRVEEIEAALAFIGEHLTPTATDLKKDIGSIEGLTPEIKFNLMEIMHLKTFGDLAELTEYDFTVQNRPVKNTIKQVESVLAVKVVEDRRIST